MSDLTDKKDTKLATAAELRAEYDFMRNELEAGTAVVSFGYLDGLASRAIAALAAAEQRVGELEKAHRRFPLTTGGSVPWLLGEEGYRTYAKFNGNDQSIERMAQRGGFAFEELACLVQGHTGYGQPQHLDCIEALRRRLSAEEAERQRAVAAEAEVARLRAENQQLANDIEPMRRAIYDAEEELEEAGRPEGEYLQTGIAALRGQVAALRELVEREAAWWCKTSKTNRLAGSNILTLQLTVNGSAAHASNLQAAVATALGTAAAHDARIRTEGHAAGVAEERARALDIARAHFSDVYCVDKLRAFEEELATEEPTT